MFSVQPSATYDHFPTRLTSLVGRERDVEAICSLFRNGDRLVTLTGPGGIGKTRLAIEVANTLLSEFPDGISFLPLAAIADAELMVPTIVRALGLQDHGVRTPWETLSTYLKTRHLLLVLDNFEQLVEEAAVLVELLINCPKLRILVTSRAVLHLSLERDYAVPPLELPDSIEGESLEEIAEFATVRLFVARARTAWTEFGLTQENAQAVAEICQHLDGLPLAIELAAARVRYLSPSAMLERMERRLPVLSGGPRDQPERLRTMRDAIAWSYNLLNEGEQRLFRRLSVFVAGFSLDAAEAVSHATRAASMLEQTERHADLELSALDDLTSLVDKSLIQVTETPLETGTRFRMLETIREFGLEQLKASGDSAVADVFRAHAEWCLDLAVRTEPELHSPSQHHWSQLLETEHDNLRAALMWLDQSGDAETNLRLATALASFWWFGGHLREGLRWLERALANGATAPALLRAQALEGAGFLAQAQGADEYAEALLQQSLDLYRQIDDARGIAGTLYSLGVAAEDRGSYDQSAAFLGESAARSEALGDRRTKTFAHLHLGIVAYGHGDLRKSVAQSEAGIALARAIDSRLGEILGTFSLALVATDRGEYSRAASHYREIVEWMDTAGVFGDIWPRRSGDSTGRTLSAIAALAAGCKRMEQAAQLLGAAAADYEAIGHVAALPERVQFERAAGLARKKLGDSTYETIFDTGKQLSPVDAKAVIEAVLTAASAQATGQGPSLSTASGLSPREHEILRLLVQGQTDNEIGKTLFISTYTVRGHVSHILTKLDVPNRTAAVHHALRHSLV
jgi:predicted ATPase/DNA-binding CsgD family transcriptional regulator